jgi:putative molybdopterin biosynthesis protein
MQPHIDALRANLQKIVDDARDTRQHLLTVCASHDLALPMLRDAAAAEAIDVDLRFQGSLDAVRSLNAGRCLVAGFHVPALRGAAPDFAQALKPLLQPGVHKLIAFCRRTQGLMMRREHAGQVQAAADLARRPLRFVNRQIGSGTRLLMDHLLREQGIAARDIEGYDAAIEESHVAVAASIASGVADVGPGVEAAALEFGLHFVPLAEEDYFLACLKPNLDHPAVERLRRLLRGPDWQHAVEALPGYAPAPAPGEVLPMATVLPWWNFDASEPAGARRGRNASNA